MPVLPCTRRTVSTEKDAPQTIVPVHYGASSDNIGIVRYRAVIETHGAPTDASCAPTRGSVREILVPGGFVQGGIIVAFGGMRFISADLDDVLWAQLLSDACARACEILCVHPDSLLELGPRRGWRGA